MAHGNGNGADRIIDRAADSATLTVTARLCMVLIAVVFVPLGTFFLARAWGDFETMIASVQQLEFEQRYQSLRLHNIEDELKIEAPPRWWEKSSETPATPAAVERSQ